MTRTWKEPPPPGFLNKAVKPDIMPATLPSSMTRMVDEILEEDDPPRQHYLSKAQPSIAYADSSIISPAIQSIENLIHGLCKHIQSQTAEIQRLQKSLEESDHLHQELSDRVASLELSMHKTTSVDSDTETESVEQESEKEYGVSPKQRRQLLTDEQIKALFYPNRDSAPHDYVYLCYYGISSTKISVIKRIFHDIGLSMQHVKHISFLGLNTLMLLALHQDVDHIEATIKASNADAFQTASRIIPDPRDSVAMTKIFPQLQSASEKERHSTITRHILKQYDLLRQYNRPFTRGAASYLLRILYYK